LKILDGPAMNKPSLIKFSSQASADVLEALKQISEAEGRKVHSIIDEALRDYIDRRQNVRPRQHVLAALGSSIAEFDQLYRELAK